MKLAISAVQKKEMSLRQAAAAYSVPKDSLNRRVKGKLKSLSEEEIHKNVLGRYRAILSHEQEKELEDYIIKMDAAFYGLSINDIRTVVFEYCQKNNIKNNFNSDNKMAGRDFVAGFLKRYPRLSLRKPEAVSINRVFGLNRTSINIYFDNLKTVLDQYQFQPHEIFNCDESGLTCVHKPVKVIAPKGKRCVSSATSAECGQTTTILIGCSASGVYVPPMMIFKRKRNKPELVDHAPVGTIGRCSPNGWIDTDLFLEYLKHFVAHTKCSKGSPVLLILDGHKTHTKSVASIDYAHDNGVVLLSLPPHTSHKLQPLDRSFFKPLKAAFNATCSTWLRQHPGRRITVDQLGELFNAAYLVAATVENAVSGFKCTGIVPVNPDILPASNFLDDPRGDVQPSSDEQSPINVASPNASQSNNVARISTMPTTPESHHVPDETKPQSADVSFCGIQNVPSIPEKRKSKRSEESQIVTSSPYKQSLLDHIAEQNTKPKKKCSANPKRAKKAKVAPKSKTTVPAGTGSEDNAQCPMCDGFWSESLPGEEWVQCSMCENWLHEECCTNVTPSSATCDICM